MPRKASIGEGVGRYGDVAASGADPAGAPSGTRSPSDQSSKTLAYLRTLGAEADVDLLRAHVRILERERDAARAALEAALHNDPEWWVEAREALGSPASDDKEQG